MTTTRVLSVTLAALALLGAGAEPAMAWRRTVGLSGLCGGTVVRATVATSRLGSAAAEALPDPCAVTVDRGATLRLVGLDAEGGRVTFVLRGGASLETNDTRIVAQTFGIHGSPGGPDRGSGGAVRIGAGTALSADRGGYIGTRGDIDVRRATIGFGAGTVELHSGDGVVEILDAALSARYGANVTGRQGVRAIGMEAGGGAALYSAEGDVLVVDSEGRGLAAWSGLPAERAVVVVDSDAEVSIALDDRSGAPRPAYRTCVAVGNVPPAACP